MAPQNYHSPGYAAFLKYWNYLCNTKTGLFTFPCMDATLTMPKCFLLKSLLRPMEPKSIYHRQRAHLQMQLLHLLFPNLHWIYCIKDSKKKKASKTGGQIECLKSDKCKLSLPHGLLQNSPQSWSGFE